MREGPSSSHLSRVVKVGGSLFADARLPSQFLSWLNDQPPACTFVLTGGGRLADEIRELDKRFALPGDVSHQLAIQTMRAQASVLRTSLAAAGCSSQWLGDLSGDSPSPAIVFVDPVRLMAGDAQTASPLAASWEVTSDSIAARLAATVDAHELVLLKSITPTLGKNLQDLASDGYVDREFADEVSPWLERGGRLTFATISQYA